MATEITWLGHSTFSIQVDGIHVLIDPFLDDCPTAAIKASDAQADYILISHGHFDHVADVESIAQRTDATIVSNFEICQWYQNKGFEKTEQMNVGGAITLPFGKVKATIAHHSSSFPDGSYAGVASGFLLSLPGGNIYFACDTSLFDEMKSIGEVGLKIAFLPMGDRFTMGPDDAVQATKLLCPETVVPMHYNTWPPIEQDAEAWAVRIANQTSAKPLVLSPGDKMTL